MTNPIIELIYKFSGIIAMFIAWFFVVAPAVQYGIDGTRQSITSATVKSKKVLRVVTLGLVIGALFQGLFLFYLIQRFQLNLLSFGSLMYLTANIATIFVAFLHFNKHPKLHEIFAKYYFISSPLSLGFIGYEAMKINSNLFPFSILVVILYLCGSIWTLKKFKREDAYLEMWIFFVLSVWTIVFSII